MGTAVLCSEAEDGVRVWTVAGVQRWPLPMPQRLASAGLDLAVCAALTALRPRRRLATFFAIAAVYHVGCWSLTGRTAGGLLTGQRLGSADGRRVAPWQAPLRLAAPPAAGPAPDRRAQ